jgi:hypothetical protein
LWIGARIAHDRGMGRFADMFVDPDADPRTDPPARVDERATITAFLRWQRDTLELKCSGLDAAGLARRSVDVSTLSLLGLLRHMAEVERGWFRRVMAGQAAPPHFYSDADPDGDFDGAAPDPKLVEEAWEVWRSEVAFAERFRDPGARPRGHRRRSLARGGVAALGAGPHGGGVRPPQRPRRPAPPGDRRRGGPLTSSSP